MHLHRARRRGNVRVQSCHSRARNRVVIISERNEQVRYNQTTFVQQWTHKLHFKPNDGGRVSRWEIYGDVVACRRICGVNSSIPITDVRSKELQGDEFFVRCSLDTNEFEGVWHTEAQVFLQFDRLSRDDNTVLLIECCRCSNHEVVARTHVNLASFLNNSNQSVGLQNLLVYFQSIMGRRSRSKQKTLFT
ncbi:hypothetical protein Plhal304r1_c080g0166251 [Plasmopara halstedii]